jgi:hypothetical protein
MSKPPTKAVAQSLPKEVLAALEKWWFEEHLGYAGASARLKQEFGIHMSVGGTMTRLYERMQRRREKSETLRTFLGDSMEMARETIAEAGPDGERVFFKAGMIQIGALVMKLADTSEADPETMEQLKGVFQTLAAGMRETRGADALAFEVRKYQDQTCERFLDDTKRAEAERIASSDLNRAEKIAGLRQVFFADVNALEASGGLVLPE